MPSQGYIKARVYTSKAGIPVQDVTVSIEKKLTDGWELLSVQRTDRSGMTQPVSVDTPDVAQSRTQDNGQGWTDITIFADSPLFERVVAQDVQIFPGVTTLQNFELVPLAELPEQWSQTETFLTTPQTL